MPIGSNNQFDIQLYPGKVGLWAEVGGSGEKIDVIAASLSFSLNDIPSGQLTLAMGYNIETLELSAAHTILKDMTTTADIKVFCKLEPDILAAGEIPDGTFMIFDGYTAGPVGVSKSISGQLALTLQIVGWLQDLNYSSAASPLLYPDAPENLFKLVNYDPILGGMNSKMVAVSDLEKQARGLSQDVWGTLKKLLEKLASGKAVQEFLGGPAPISNTLAIAALNRFGKNIQDVVLSLDLPFSLSPIPEAMADTMAGSLFSTISGTTLWSKILLASNLFSFDIVTTPDSAAAVPHFPALVGEPFATIKASEQFSLNLQPSLPRQIAAIWLTRRVSLGLSNALDPSEYGFLVGAADTSMTTLTGQPRGMTIIKSLPEWLAQDLPAALLTPKPSEKMSNVQKRKPSNPVSESNILRMKSEGVGHIIAKALLLLEQYKMRVGSITGKLRFDIGPGSFVKIEGTGLPTIGLSPSMLADVTQVNLSFNAMVPAASTSFVVSHIRSEKEASSGLDKNPIYDEPWVGTALIEGAI